MTRIIEVPVTGSTNADMLALAGQTFQEGEWLIAERQQAGRGRQGRVWNSPSGNLYATGLIRLRADDPVPSTLGLLAGIALFDAVAPLLPAGSGLALKWPNDLVAGSAKLAGILLERQGEWIAAGFGVNIAHAPLIPGRATTSVRALGGQTTPRLLVERLAIMFDEKMAHWRSLGAGATIADWRARTFVAGTAMGVTATDGQRREGRFAGIADDGALLLQTANGAVATIYAADVDMIAGDEGRDDAARN